MTPIVLSSTFAQDGPGNHKGYDYSRSGNPTRNTLEACAAALEGARHGLAFARAARPPRRSCTRSRPGDHVVCGDDVYGGTFRILDKVMKPDGRHGDLRRHERPRAPRRPFTPETKMVWLETPSNPMLKVFDIEACAPSPRRGASPWWSTTPSRRPCSSGRWGSARRRWCTRRRSTSTGTPTWWAAW
jgi:cystathionine beta-lyase/cystathionine gamma-synthase